MRQQYSIQHIHSSDDTDLERYFSEITDTDSSIDCDGIQGSGTLCEFHTHMWERTICGFRAGRRAWVYAASLLCRHINVIKNSDFLSSISGIRTTSVFGGSIMWIASYTCCLFSGWALTFIAALRPLAIVTNPHIVLSQGSKETYIQFHNLDTVGWTV